MTHQITFLLILIFFACCSNNTISNIPSAINPVGTNSFKSNSHWDTISTEKFWTLVDNAIKFSNGNDSLKEKYLVTELEKLSLDEIINFDIAFHKCVIDADDFKVMAALKIIADYVSDDYYLYFRCWLIGQGKTVYTVTLKNPDFLATIVNKGDECDWESIMYVATKAYSKKTGKKEDESFPREIALSLGLDYNFGAPPTKGKDWTEEQLPNLLPKLWAKFN